MFGNRKDLVTRIWYENVKKLEEAWRARILRDYDLQIVIFLIAVTCLIMGVAGASMLLRGVSWMPAAMMICCGLLLLIMVVHYAFNSRDAARYSMAKVLQGGISQKLKDIHLSFCPAGERKKQLLAEEASLTEELIKLEKLAEELGAEITLSWYDLSAGRASYRMAQSYDRVGVRMFLEQVALYNQRLDKLVHEVTLLRQDNVVPLETARAE